MRRKLMGLRIAWCGNNSSRLDLCKWSSREAGFLHVQSRTKVWRLTYKIRSLLAGQQMLLQCVGNDITHMTHSWAISKIYPSHFNNDFNDRRLLNDERFMFQTQILQLKSIYIVHSTFLFVKTAIRRSSLYLSFIFCWPFLFLQAQRPAAKHPTVSPRSTWDISLNLPIDLRNVYPRKHPERLREGRIGAQVS
jgi:hypothetical protein